ncbi:hypothetical protein DSO57_1007658 [Entomophthora muscae]|uniref:Uncharacterized protein n=1 Tax=Entomophthora muscae TaxID=34485 RepID=A0ACC2T7L9_9FUNG|nr:hypothetical protein DSO57_1007658 [Entomophthora muscae]
MTDPKKEQSQSTPNPEETQPSRIPTGGKVLYTAPKGGQEYVRPLTLDQIYRLCRVTILHWSFGLILIPTFKTFFGMSLSFHNPLFFVLLLQTIGCGLLELFLWTFAETPLKKPINWSEEVIVITGGSHGLGLLLAQSFAIKRATVAILDIKEPPSKDMGFYYYECDVGNSKAVAEALRELKEDIGVPTVLINNAGIIRPSLIANSNVVDIEKTIRVNLLGSIWTTKMILPWMLKEDRGFIVNISSVLGVSCPAQACAYNASKAGLNAFHETLHQEISSCHKTKNIKTLLVSPGMLPTGMFDGVKHKFPRIFCNAQPLEVVQKIMYHIEYRVSGELETPLYTSFAPLARFFPLCVRHFVYDYIGANDALSSWKGHDGSTSSVAFDTKDANPTVAFS